MLGVLATIGWFAIIIAILIVLVILYFVRRV